MHIIQFWRIFWARRLLIIAATVSCLVGGVVLTRLLPPRYDSHARVMLGLLKPDPVTGQAMASGSLGAYVNTQIELITDFSVAGKVADAVGWTSDPNLISAYENRSKKDQRDFQHWLAQRVIDRTKAKLLDESNILEITFSSSTPRDAQAVAEVLERAYLDTSVALRREDATRQAEWFEQQAATAQADLTKAEDVKAEYERANGVMMSDDHQDLESARLQILTQQSVTPTPTIPPPIQSSQSAIELAQLDAEINQQSKILGPNHPELVAMREKRAALAGLVAKDEAAQRAAYSAMSSSNSAGARALSSAIEKQKNQVIAQADKLEHLKQLQSEINSRREQFNKATAQAADFRQQAAVVNNGLSILGHATTPSAPSFPNMLLIVPGSLVLGFVFGVLLALLAEFLAWRVRGVEDLRGFEDVPVLAVIPGLRDKHKRAPSKKAGSGSEAQNGRWRACVSMNAVSISQQMDLSPDLAPGFSFSPLLAFGPNAPPGAAEAVRALRSSFMVRHVQAGRRAVAVCSATPGVGCTLTAVNLALSLSQIGVKTLLVDADLRQPGVDQFIRPPTPRRGLTQCLASDDAALDEFIEPDVAPNLSVLFAGGPGPNPQELLAGPRFEELMALCLRDFEATIVDTAPASQSADARRVSNVVGYSLIVARSNVSYLHDLKTLLGQLREDHVRIVGSVLNER